jgi:hypothetical protein
MSNEPKATDQSASTPYHQGNGKLRHIRSEIRTRLRRLLDGGLRRRRGRERHRVDRLVDPAALTRRTRCSHIRRPGGPGPSRGHQRLTPYDGHHTRAPVRTRHTHRPTGGWES